MTDRVKTADAGGMRRPVSIFVRGADLLRVWTAKLIQGPVRSFTAHTLFRAAWIGLLAYEIDLLATQWNIGLARVSINIPAPGSSAADLPNGARFIAFLLAYLGVLPTVVVALTSLAVTTLAAYGSPSLLMLMSRYPQRWWDRALAPFVGRAGPFQRALIFSMALTTSLLLLAASRQLGWTKNELPVVIFVLLLGAAALFSVLLFVVWLVDLRRPSQVVLATSSVAASVLRWIHELGADRPLTPQVWRGVASPYQTVYREQEQLKRCVYALTESAIKTLSDRQQFSARESIQALRNISDGYRKTDPLPHTWGQLRQGEDKRWFDNLLLESFEGILVAAVGLHERAAADEASGELKAIALHLAKSKSSPEPPELLRAMKAFETALDECAEYKEHSILELLIEPTATMLDALAKSGDTHPEAIHEVRDLLVGTQVRAITNDDVPAVRSLLMIYTRLRSNSTLRIHATSAAIDLGATALAARRYQAASVLIDWFLNEGPAAITTIADAARDHDSQHASPRRPSYVTSDYERVFVLLAASRVAHIRNGGLAYTEWAPIHAFSSPLDNAGRRAEFVLERMAKVVSYAPQEIKDWGAAVGRFTSDFTETGQPEDPTD